MNKFLLASALAAVLVSGCASRGKAAGSDDAASAGSGSGVDSSASSAPADTSGLGNGRPLPASGTGSSTAAYDISKKTVYFGYDSSEPEADGQTVIENYAKYLTTNIAAKVRLEGNTDERGSREYNLALSERRAQSVALALKAKGVAEGQLSLVSYGEEHPADPGHDEEAWGKNRRVDIAQ